MLLTQHQQSITSIVTINRGWSGTIGVMSSCFNLDFLPIIDSVSPNRSRNTIEAKYLDSRLTEGQR